MCCCGPKSPAPTQQALPKSQAAPSVKPQSSECCGGGAKKNSETAPAAQPHDAAAHSQPGEPHQR
jgi:hypothetical protein